MQKFQGTVYGYMKTNIQGHFQIYMSVPLRGVYAVQAVQSKTSGYHSYWNKIGNKLKSKVSSFKILKTKIFCTG